MINEANISQIDTQTAAIKFSYSFKQLFVKMLIQAGIPVDRKQSFTTDSGYSWEKRQKNHSIYSKYDSAEYERYSSDIGLKVFTHDNKSIHLTADTMGGVKVDYDGDEIGVVKITNITSEVFLNKVISLIKNANQSNQEIDIVEKLKSFASKNKLVYDFDNDIHHLDSTIFIVAMTKKIPKKVDYELTLYDAFRSFIYKSFEYQPSLKAAYKKATGNSAGKKYERFSVADEVSSKTDLFKMYMVGMSIDEIKNLSLAVDEFVDANNYIIIDIDIKLNAAGDNFLIKYTISKKWSFKKERGSYIPEKRNIYDFVRELKSKYVLNVEKIISDENKNIEKHILPVAHKLVQLAFKDS